MEEEESVATQDDVEMHDSADDPLDISSSDSSQMDEDDKSFKFFENVNQKSFAKRIRLLERKILLGLLSEVEEERLRKSKYFTSRFEKLIKLSSDLQKANLYKLISNITLNEKRIADLKSKPGKKSKIEYYQNRERAVQKKLSISALSQKELSGLISDPFFCVTFGDGLLKLEHDLVSQPEESEAAAVVEDEMLCDYCRQGSKDNKFGQLLVCTDCESKGHPACLNYSEELAEQIRTDGSWQCINCKACSICDGTHDPDKILFCDCCDKGYHMTCHDPKIDQMPTGKWACASCLAKGKQVPSDSSSPVTVQPTALPTVPPTPAQEVFIIDDDDEIKNPEEDVKMDEEPVTAIASPKPTSPKNSPKTALVSPIVSSVTTAPQRQTNAVQPTPVHAPRHMNPTIHPGRPRMPAIQQAGMYHYIPPGMSPRTMQMPVPMANHQPVPIPYSVMPMPNGGTIPVPATVAMQNGGTPTVLGKGVQNPMTNILSPKVPLPDVRSSIREDVLRQLPPDVADWSVQDVSYYFKSHGYVTEGSLLEEQEIDGRALLLMSRNDVLTGLRIKLGPAIKIYHMHVQKLQTRTDFIG